MFYQLQHVVDLFLLDLRCCFLHVPESLQVLLFVSSRDLLFHGLLHLLDYLLDLVDEIETAYGLLQTFLREELFAFWQVVGHVECLGLLFMVDVLGSDGYCGRELLEVRLRTQFQQDQSSVHVDHTFLDFEFGGEAGLGPCNGVLSVAFDGKVIHFADIFAVRCAVDVEELDVGRLDADFNVVSAREECVVKVLE